MLPELEKDLVKNAVKVDREGLSGIDRECYDIVNEHIRRHSKDSVRSNEVAIMIDSTQYPRRMFGLVELPDGTFCGDYVYIDDVPESY